jgi:hypothetical protein
MMFIKGILSASDPSMLTSPYDSIIQALAKFTKLFFIRKIVSLYEHLLSVIFCLNRPLSPIIHFALAWSDVCYPVLSVESGLGISPTDLKAPGKASRWQVSDTIG